MTINEFRYGVLTLYPALSCDGGFEICLAGNSGCYELEKFDYMDLSVLEIRQVVGQSKMSIRPAIDIEVKFNYTLIINFFKLQFGVFKIMLSFFEVYLFRLY